MALNSRTMHNFLKIKNETTTPVSICQHINSQPYLRCHFMQSSEQSLSETPEKLLAALQPFKELCVH